MLRKQTLLALVAMTVSILLSGCGQWPQPDSVSSQSVDYSTLSLPDHFDTRQAEEMLTLLNAARQDADCAPLTMDTGNLMQAARTRAKELTVCFAHERPNGASWESVFEQFGVTGRYRGENLAQSHAAADEIFQSWLSSSTHKANMLNTDFTHVSIACFSYNDTCYWVQLFR